MGNVAKAKSALVQLSLAILVAVTAPFAQATPALAADGSTYFTDVHEDDWFNADVGYAYERGILLGTDDDTFSPLEATSRGMVVTVLYRFEGKPSPSAKSTFPDVDQDEFYADAVAWGEEVGVVAGFDDGLFRPNDPVTREQLAVFLQRYAEFKGYDAEAEADLSDFSDEDEVSAFAQAAVEWANANGLIRGLDDGRLAPRSNASRAEFAAILNRFFKAFVPDSLTVTFDLGYGDDSVYAKTIVEDGKTVERPDDPVRSGYDFVGWYTAKTGGEKFDFDSAITKDVTLYARWSARSNPRPTPEYTVTFNSNEGSEVSSQKVLKGECATEPEAPAKDGFTFEGWFSDEALTKAYDFDSPVTSDITLYAKWESSASDDLGDEESAEVTENDQFNLSVDRDEVSLSSDETIVTFKVSSTLTTGTIRLYQNGQDTGVQLYDDGGFTYGTSVDDIPNDGVYTAEYTISSDTDADIKFEARATVGGTEIKSNTVTIFAYYDLADAELSVMAGVEAGISGAMRNAEASLPEGAGEEQAAAARYSAVITYLQTKVSDGTIEALFGDEEFGNISFVYTATGISGAAQCTSFDVSSNPEASIDSPASENVAREHSSSTPGIQLQSDDTGIDYVTYRERATILNYCAEDDPDEASRIEAYQGVANQLGDASFEVDEQYGVTVDNFKNLNDYQLIITDCHGSTYTHWFTTTPVICTDEEATSEAKTKYSADLKKNRIVAGSSTTGNKFWIRPDFFDFYYADDRLDCSIFYLNVCMGAYDEDKALVNSILDAGADSVVAYSNTVYTFYGTSMLSDIVDSLMSGSDISQAVEAAKAENGQNDREWGLNQSWAASGGVHDHETVASVFGDTSALLHNDLVNGDFDSFFDLFSDSISNWNEYGDARSVFKLAGIKPPSLFKMGMISSGFGSQNDETTSCIYQTILVPSDASTINFTYDVVSEEPMEYVGTRYNDTFDFEILDVDGNVLETLASESVNDSMWYAVNGIDFPGGDDTTFHTRWQTVTSNAISKYRNELVVIRAIVRDAGDSIYDTAALVDSVTIS